MDSKDYIRQARERLTPKLDKFSPYYDPPKRKHRKQPERDLQSAIIQLLNLKGHFVWKTVNRGFKLETGAWIPPANQGVPDIVGLTKTGVFLGIEVKVKGNKATAAQEAFLEEIRRRGGVGLTVYSISEVEDL